MRVLAFDCSGARGGVAVTEDGAVVFAETFECPRGRGGELFDALERAVNAAGRIERIAVGIGPGSYNGLRTAIAAAEGLRLATGAELAGVASVRALPCDNGEYVAVSDARGGVFYHVRVRDRALVGEFELLDASVLAGRLEGETAPVFSAAPLAAFPQATVVFPDATILAVLGQRDTPAVGTVEPLYLKPAHITKPKPQRSRGV